MDNINPERHHTHAHYLLNGLCAPLNLIEMMT